MRIQEFRTMVVSSFEQNIIALDFTLKKGEEDGNVILTADFENSNLTPQELFALETAKKKFDADAVYFRYFNDGRGAVPQIYIYNNTEKKITDKDKKDIHIKVWSGCQVPVYIVIEKDQVQVFDAREKVDDDIANHAFKTIQLTGQAIKDFSAKNFDDGLFWEEENSKNNFQFKTSAYRDLIDGLQKVYFDFQKNTGLNKHTALKLLVQCLLIKYLEERDDKSGYFSKKYFKNNFQCANFCEVIRTGQLLDLLDHLAEDFNGKIFKWHKEKEVEQRKAINQSEVKSLADYLDGNVTTKGEFVLWPQYSFSHLPVELISSVYETLLTNSKDIVYTPEMIVSTLVDECMPLKTPQQNFKVIDVSCGSGIFLVKAYKRIIQWWRYEKWLETKELVRPSLSELKRLLINSIYGVDIEEDAIRLSVFSLALALLDEVDLNPPTWQILKFPDLGDKNIIAKDFFKYITNTPPNYFDLVIGNPPFNLQAVNGKEPNREIHFKNLEKTIGYKSDIKIPDNNPALHFLVQATKLLKQDAMLCLIQPSGPFLYQKDKDFKTALFTQNNLLQIIDFTKLANVLWGKRTIATAAIFLQKTLPDNLDVVHIIANRTFSNVNKLFLELDHYDFHSVDKKAVLENPYVWKSNLLGGGRIVPLISRTSGLRTINEFVEKKEANGWKAGEGFIASERGSSCNYITGKTFLPTKAFKEYGVDWQQTENCTTQKFHRPRSEKIYTPPHILLKANLGQYKLLTFLSDEYIVFKDKIIGIHAPEKDRQELESLFNYINEYSDFLRFYIACTSGQVSINRATALIKEDLMNLPYPENSKAIKISLADKIILNDVLTYKLKSSEPELFQITTDTQIKAFSEIFCQTLNSVYQEDAKAFRLYKVLDAGNYYALHFEYSEVKHKAVVEVANDLEKYIQAIIPTEKKKGKSIHIQRIVKVYGKDTIILAKPKQLRYWLQSIALRDADETFADYVKAHYY
ncbi:MAG: N-6 DNA methylase [Flavobacterium sp.]|nr:N-6 DNA methylase [Flavobacterium sp.]